jgi:hypothetical protein
MLMDNFAHGVETLGDSVVKYMDQQTPIENLDAGFILGYTLENNFRRKLIDHLKKRNIPTVFVDSNILHYARPEHEWHRYSINSVYPNTGLYFFGPVKPKWQTYSSWHNVKDNPWRSTGKHILLLAQRPHGWNMFGNDQMHWINQTVTRIKRSTDRPIVVRMHPGDGSRHQQIEIIISRWGNQIQVSSAENIKQDLVNCWAAVGYNSTPNAVAAIEGVPVYVDDPLHSWATDVAFKNLADIENPVLPDRSQWLEKIANIHWSNLEVRQGKLWAAIKQCILTAQV